MIAAVQQLADDARASKGSIGPAQPQGRNPTLLDAYKVLSWDSHAVMVSARDLHVGKDQNGPEASVSHALSAGELASLAAFMTFDLLAYGWHTLMREFDLPLP